MRRKPTAEEVAEKLAGIQKMPVCEDCDVLRGANVCAARYFGKQKAMLFQKNLGDILTTHVDLGCQPCHADQVMKLMQKDRLAAIAAIL